MKLSAAAHLASLRERGVSVWLEHGQLRYRADKGVLSTDDLAQLREMRDAIVVELTSTEAVTQIQALPDFVSAPISFQQQWLLALMQRHDDWQRTQVFAFHLTGGLSTETLERSVTAILSRHHALRACIVSQNGAATQRLQELRNYHLDVVSIAADPASYTQHDLHSQIRTIGQRLIDPAVGPMLRVILLQISEHEHCLVLAAHRLAADCLSISLALREIWLQYEQRIRATCDSQGVVLTEAAQYSDYALWQQLNDAQWQQKHGVYWEEYLAGATCIHWPTDVNACSGARGVIAVQRSLGETLSSKLREFGRQTQMLPSLIMLSLYVAVISHRTGQSDFVLPFNIVGRRAAHESVVGYFSHLQYLRIRLPRHGSFMEILRGVSQEFYKAVYRQDFGRAALQHPQLMRGTFCQWLSWHPADGGGPELGDILGRLGLAIEPVRFQGASELANVPAAATDLDISFFQASGQFEALAIFRTDRFSPRTVEQLLQELQDLAEQAVKGS